MQADRLLYCSRYAQRRTPLLSLLGCVMNRSNQQGFPAPANHSLAQPSSAKGEGRKAKGEAGRGSDSSEDFGPDRSSTSAAGNSMEPSGKQGRLGGAGQHGPGTSVPFKVTAMDGRIRVGRYSELAVLLRGGGNSRCGQ